MVFSALAIPAQAVAQTPVAVPPKVPPNLQALEQKMGELKVTSLRFSEQTSVTVPHGQSKILKLLKLLLGTGISGEVTTSPTAGNVVLSLFGHPLTLRVVDGTTYFYLRALGRVDHGRPWVKLGPGGLAELFTVNGKHIKAPKTSKPKIGEPALAEPPFEGLRHALAGAREVRELGAGTSTVSRSRAFSQLSNRNNSIGNTSRPLHGSHLCHHHRRNRNRRRPRSKCRLHKTACRCVP